MGGGRRRQSCSRRSAGPVTVTVPCELTFHSWCNTFLLSLSLYLSRALSDCVNPPAVSADGTVRDPPVRGAAEQLNQVSHQAGCAATSSQLTLVPAYLRLRRASRTNSRFQPMPEYAGRMAVSCNNGSMPQHWAARRPSRFSRSIDPSFRSLRRSRQAPHFVLRPGADTRFHHRPCQVAVDAAGATDGRGGQIPRRNDPPRWSRCAG